jgi:hypothetical protein
VIPLKFLAERIMVVSCMNYEAKKDAQRVLSSAPSQRFSALSSKKKGAKSTKAVSSKAQSRKPAAEPEDAPEDGVGFSTKNSPPTRQQSQLLQQDDSWNGSAVSGGSGNDGALSRKTKAVSFRSNKGMALDENYLSELDGEQAEFSFSTKIRQYTAK